MNAALVIFCALGDDCALRHNPRLGHHANHQTIIVRRNMGATGLHQNLDGGTDLPAVARHAGRRIVWCALLVAHFAIGWLYTSMRADGSDAAWHDFPLDDSWIHMVYGRSLAQTGLPAYNDGELEAGFTAPAWVVACAVAHWLSWITPLSAVSALKLIGILSAWLMSVGAYELARAWSATPAMAWFAGIACVLTPHLVFAQVSGMETTLAAGMALWSVVFLHRHQFMAAGLALAGAYWARPEMLLLAPLFACGVVADRVWNGSAIRAAALGKLFAPLLVCGMIWAGYCVSISGRPLPNTFYTKARNIELGDVWVVMREFALDDPLRLRGAADVTDPMSLSGAGWNNPLSFAGVGLALWLVGAWRLQRDFSAARLVAIVFPVVFLIAIPLSRQMLPRSGTFYSVARYAIPAMPFFFVAITVGLGQLWSWRGSIRPRIPEAATARWLPRGLALGCVLIMLIRTPEGLYRNAQLFAWNCRNINEVQVALGKWVAANTDPQDAFLLSDAGALRYFGGRRAIDLLGLNWHELALDRELRVRIGSTPAELSRYMRDRNARYVIFFKNFFPLLVDDPGFSRQFSLVDLARSQRYTILPTDLSTMFIYRRVSE
ncbi:MAG: hypothetical protein JNG88_06680 [Phycisphaerales bacterium]|nr:hypothetical protein [Phycisphaerales bacterium]